MAAAMGPWVVVLLPVEVGGGCCCVVVGIKAFKVVKYVQYVVEFVCVEAILRGGISRAGEIGGRASGYEWNAADNWLLLLRWRWLGVSGCRCCGCWWPDVGGCSGVEWWWLGAHG